ncbi:Cyclochlorotine biosynthesis protein O [Lachnellula hyalina]|uniref:Cyclochlorotine biosynthesis protein O n=1 Tax=Lachnellula hyalina TaxID=1316788 RepID=A0A8H8R253_9HELO|nr:Cyclochlorotine biosynthesis protein O [Lachnellula hyalina]TVY26375.1 Cyclochlorotine biosynthesis protein O [Lachnellula hyalina]
MGSTSAIANLSVIHDMSTTNLQTTRSRYSGPPHPDIDRAWDDLFRLQNIRVTGEEFDFNQRTSVELLEGGGYMAWLGIFHELHCVVSSPSEMKILRQWKYKEHYFKDNSEGENRLLESHTDHCLDRIRSSLMCHPDVSSLVTFYWGPDAPQPVVNATKTMHSCVNWDGLMESTRYRALPSQELKELKNPLLQ